jgi:SPP1 family phage portal protein
MIIIYDDTIEQNIIYAIRKVPCYDIVNDKHYNKLEVYSAESIKYYTADEAFSTITFKEEKPHFFGDVPVVEYKNNEMEIGDYETIIPLIDAYDRLESDSLDDYDSFVDAYMILRGVNLGKSEEDMRDAVKKFQEQRVMVFPDGESSVEYLTKDSSDTIVENLKNRISADIHKFAKVPDLADKEFASNASGIAIKFKLYGTETLVANKERFFLKGLQRRIELIFNILNIKGNSYSWQDIEVQFTRNVPTNESEIADVVQKLSGTVSTETLLAQIPFVTDVGAEMEKLEGDKARNPFYNLALETEGVSEDEEV